MTNPKHNPSGTDSVSSQELKEWHAAGDGVPLQYKGREHVWNKKVAKFAAGGEVYNTVPDMKDGGDIIQGPAYARGGEVHMQFGGIAKVFKGAQKVLPAAEREANLAKMLEGSAAKERVYHGTGNLENLRSFDPAMTGRGTDQLGSGFYFSTHPDEASGYATTFNPPHRGGETSKIGGSSSPGVVPAYLSLKKPINIKGSSLNDADVKLSQKHALEMIRRAPNIRHPEDTPLHDWFDLSRTGGVTDSMLRDVAKNYQGSSLNSLSNDFYRNNPTEFRHALRDVTGHDSVVQDFGDGRKHYVAWFPEQIKSATGNRGTYDLTSPDVNKAEGGEIRLDKGGAATGVFPQMKPKRSKQDREAAKNVPVDLARGFTAGVLGAPGEIESVIRMLPGLDERTVLPTYEEIEKRLPLRSDTPVSRAATGLGSLAGGFYSGPGAPIRVAGALPGAIKHGAQEFAKASASGVPHVIKPKGGNWLTGSVEKSLAPLKQRMARAADENFDPARGVTFGEISSMDALNNWVDRNLINYVKKEMATPEDPVRKLAEQGIVHIPSEQVGVNRYRAPKHREAYGGEQLGKSEAARAWEDASDVAINAPTAQGIKTNESLYQANPWIEKLANEDRVYALNTPASRAQEISGLGFDHIMDVLRQDLASGRIRPEQLNKVSITDAVRRTHQFDEEMAKKMRDAQVKVTEGMPVHKEYPEGYRWVELTAGEKAKAKVVPLEGGGWTVEDATGHQMSGGFKSKEGAERALAQFSKSDPRYKEAFPQSKVTALEDALKYEGDTMGHCVGNYCPDVVEGRSRIFSLRDAKGEPHVTVEVQPHGAHNQDAIFRQLMDKLGRDPTMEEFQSAVAEAPSRIVQIKGKQNAAPKADYLPYVQDFVKGGEWSDVGDLRNTGLRRTSDAFNENEIKKIKAAGLEVPTWATPDEIKTIGDKVWPGQYGTPPGGIPEGMAHGGAVHMQSGGVAKFLKGAIKAPEIIVPSKLTELKDLILKSEGEYAAKRLERAADEIPNLERMYKPRAIKEAFSGDNAKAVATMRPADFERYAAPLSKKTSVGPKAAELAKNGEIDKHTVTTDEYLKHLQRIKGGFDDVPFLGLMKQEAGLPLMPYIRGHEGRHRSRALADQGETKNLVRILPGSDLREGLPRRSQEEFIDALRQEMEQTGRLVLPEKYFDETAGAIQRPAIELPDLYAKGGEVHMGRGGILKKGFGELTDLLKPLERAPAKSKEEIEAIAHRIAPQMLGEFVRGKAGTQSVAGKTQKQFAREKDLPVDIRPTKGEHLQEPKKVDYEKLMGNVMMGIPGDTSITGKSIHGVGDIRLEYPSPQHGGPLYGHGREDEKFWASGINAARRVQNLGKEIQRQYDAPVLGKYIMMGPEGLPYAQHFADANLQAIDLSKMSKRQIEGFNKLIRQGSPKSGPRQNFPGIEDKNEAYLHMAFDPELRKHFNQLMEMPTVTSKFNLPSGQDIRFAVTEPELRNLEVGMTGKSMGRMRPEIKDLTISSHPTYTHDIPGEFMGSTRYPVPYELSFPDTVKAVRENLKQAPQEFGSLKMVGPRQIIDQQLIDEIRQYEEAMKRLTGKKKGGAVGGLSSATKSCSCND